MHPRTSATFTGDGSSLATESLLTAPAVTEALLAASAAQRDAEEAAEHLNGEDSSAAPADAAAEGHNEQPSATGDVATSVEEEEESEAVELPEFDEQEIERRKKFLIHYTHDAVVPIPGTVLKVDATESIIFRTEVKANGPGTFVFGAFPTSLTTFAKRMRDCEGYRPNRSLAAVAGGHYRVCICPKHRLISVADFIGSGIISQAIISKDDELQIVCAMKGADDGEGYCRFYHFTTGVRECLCNLPVTVSDEVEE